MNRRELLRTSAGVAAGMTALFALQTEAAAQGEDLHKRCAKACADCMASCNVCVEHCTGMLAAGIKGHDKTLRLSLDCGDICGLASRICSRKGPMMAAICETCAKACDACGAACSKYPKMPEMQDCMKSCRACAKVCREVVKAMKN